MGWYKLIVSKIVTRYWPLVIASWLVLAVTLRMLAPEWNSIAADGDLQFLPDDVPSAIGQRTMDSAFPGTQSRSQMYFAGPEGLSLEVACGSAIDERAWIDPEVQALAGISNDDLARYVTPADFQRPATAVAQPGNDPTKPHMAYPASRYAAMLTTPDEVFWTAVTSEPPVHVSESV